jgi:hypothetical protein
MKHLLHRRDSEALIEGQPVDEDSGLDDVKMFLTSMRSEFAATPAPEPRPTLAATLDGRRELRPKSGPAPKPTFPKPRPRTHWGLRPVAALFATGAVLFGGLAGAGALPGPIQRTAASVGSHVGLHLPGRSGATPAGRDDGQPRTGPSESTSPSSKRNRSGESATTPSTAPTTPTIPAVPAVPTVPTLPNPGARPTPTVPTIPALPTPTVTVPPSLSQLLHDLAHPNPPPPLFPKQPTP